MRQSQFVIAALLLSISLFERLMPPSLSVNVRSAELRTERQWLMSESVSGFR
jgi:hypothetical protein